MPAPAPSGNRSYTVPGSVVCLLATVGRTEEPLNVDRSGDSPKRVVRKLGRLGNMATHMHRLRCVRRTTEPSDQSGSHQPLDHADQTVPTNRHLNRQLPKTVIILGHQTQHLDLKIAHHHSANGKGQNFWRL